jgi:hypothetical protein
VTWHYVTQLMNWLKRLADSLFAIAKLVSFLMKLFMTFQRIANWYESIQKSESDAGASTHFRRSVPYFGAESENGAPNIVRCKNRDFSIKGSFELCAL